MNPLWKVYKSKVMKTLNPDAEKEPAEEVILEITVMNLLKVLDHCKPLLIRCNSRPGKASERALTPLDFYFGFRSFPEISN